MPARGTGNDHFRDVPINAVADKGTPAKTVPFDGWCAAWGNLQLANPLKLAFHATRLVGLTKEGGYVHPNETGWTPERLKAGVVVKLNAHTGHWKSAFQGQAVQAGCPKRRHWLARHQWA